MMESNGIEINDCRFGRGKDTLLVIGNGFDLNLGFKTSYRDFANSSQWPFKGVCIYSHPLGWYLSLRKEKELWFDLEQSLLDFCECRFTRLRLFLFNENFVKKCKSDFDLLVKSLSEYINHQENDSLNANSSAAKLLKSCCDEIVQPSIYSFNYTDVQKVAVQLNLEGIHTLKHVHGTLASKDVILGFNKYEGTDPRWSFMVKTKNKKYNSNNIVQSIRAYKRIVIFGLSLSSIDFPYFREMFQSLKKEIEREKETKSESDRKYRIITKDDDSKNQILENIRSLAGIPIFDLQNSKSLVKIISSKDLSKFESLDSLFDAI